MKPYLSRTLGILAVGATLLGPETAMANPAKAKQLKVDMVSAYNQCTAPTQTHRPSLALPACIPVLSTGNNPTTTYTFGPKGKMSIQVQSGNGDVKISVNGSDILKNGTPATSPIFGGMLATADLRVTDTACGPGFNVPCTVVDFPFPVWITCTNGSCKTKTTANMAIPGAVHAGDAANIELSQFTIFDDDGDAAFRMGLLVP